MENIDKLVELITEKLLDRLNKVPAEKRFFLLGELENIPSLDGARTDLLEEADVIIIGTQQLYPLLRLASLSPVNLVEEGIVEAMLAGKKVYASDQNFQLQSYKQSSKTFLYKELLQKKDILEKYGVTFYQDGELGNLLAEQKSTVFNSLSSKEKQPASGKRILITESKLQEMGLSDGDTFKIEKGMLVTALARDYLNRHKISILQ